MMIIMMNIPSYTNSMKYGRYVRWKICIDGYRKAAILTMTALGVNI